MSNASGVSRLPSDMMFRSQSAPSQTYLKMPESFRCERWEKGSATRTRFLTLRQTATFGSLFTTLHYSAFVLYYIKTQRGRPVTTNKNIYLIKHKSDSWG